MSGTDLDVDVLTDPLPGDDLHHLLAEARERPGLTTVRMAGNPAYLVTRFDELKAFFLDDAAFPGETTYQFTIEQQIGPTFISMANPAHDRYRRLATPAFRSRAVTRFVDEELVPLAHEIVDRFAGRGEGDLVAELARVLPFWAISRKIGITGGDTERMRRLALAIFGQGWSDLDPAEAVAEVDSIVAPILAARRADPGEDVLSQLVLAEREGQRLTDEEIMNHVRLLFAVGATTTSDSMTSLLWALLTKPGVLELVQRQPEARAGLVHEVLRCEPAVALLPRIAMHGGTVAGTVLPAGAQVLAGIAAANRDPAHFEDPDTFDPLRSDSELLTLGFGNKFCPGSHLARQQLAVALDVVLERLPGLRLVAAEPPSGAVLRSSPSVVARWDAPGA
jgi:cytochrome P450